MDEYGLEYYLSNGALNDGALYFPVLRFSPEIQEWINDRGENIRYLVNRNPLFLIGQTQSGSLQLSDQAYLEITGLSDRRFELLLSSGDQPVTVKVHGGESYECLESINVPANNSVWFSFQECNKTPSEAILIDIQRGSGNVEILGMRFSQADQTLWPWDQGITLKLTTSEGQYRVLNLNSSQLIEPLEFEIQVIDDRGFLILAEVVQ
jgi:hypothetical protein